MWRTRFGSTPLSPLALLSLAPACSRPIGGGGQPLEVDRSDEHAQSVDLDQPTEVRVGALVWEDSVDLDGDGRLEALEVRRADPDTQRDCEGAAVALLSVGGRSLSIDLARDGWCGSPGFKIIDTDTRDHRQELLIEQVGRHPSYPTYRYAVVLIDADQLQVQELEHGDGGASVEVDGKGSLSVTISVHCTGVLQVTYELQGTHLVEVGRAEWAQDLPCED